MLFCLCEAEHLGSETHEVVSAYGHIYIVNLSPHVQIFPNDPQKCPCPDLAAMSHPKTSLSKPNSVWDFVRVVDLGPNLCTILPSQEIDLPVTSAARLCLFGFSVVTLRCSGIVAFVLLY